MVVVNFLNRNNAADQRVFELLSEKSQLFDGVFGTSDEVLGSIESGVDFEKRIVEIYQTCRSREEIQASFDALQAELSSEISEAEAVFDAQAMTFELLRSPDTDILTGLYRLHQQETVGHHYHLQHPLAGWVLAQAQQRALPSAMLVFDYGAYAGNVAALESVIGKSGLLMVRRLSIQGLAAEDYVITVAVTAGKEALTAAQASALFKLPATVEVLERMLAAGGDWELSEVYEGEKAQILETVSVRDAAFFEEEIEKLDRWAEDKRLSLKDELKPYDEDVAARKKQAREARNLPEKLMLQKQVSGLNKKRNEAWREYDRGALDVEAQKDVLIESVAARLEQSVAEETLFTVGWRLVA